MYMCQIHSLQRTFWNEPFLLLLIHFMWGGEQLVDYSLSEKDLMITVNHNWSVSQDNSSCKKNLKKPKPKATERKTLNAAQPGKQRRSTDCKTHEVIFPLLSTACMAPADRAKVTCLQKYVGQLSFYRKPKWGHIVPQGSRKSPWTRQHCSSKLPG